jgi:phosphatidate phosphatase PAH1
LVISDIDGTITKSDVLGHVIPAIGGTWAHSGVAELYTRIKNNGSNQSLLLTNEFINLSQTFSVIKWSICHRAQLANRIIPKHICKALPKAHKHCPMGRFFYRPHPF